MAKEHFQDLWPRVALWARLAEPQNPKKPEELRAIRFRVLGFRGSMTVGFRHLGVLGVYQGPCTTLILTKSTYYLADDAGLVCIRRACRVLSSEYYMELLLMEEILHHVWCLGFRL